MSSGILWAAEQISGIQQYVQYSEFKIDITETHTAFQNYFDSASMLVLWKTYHRENTLIKDNYRIKYFGNGVKCTLNPAFSHCFILLNHITVQKTQGIHKVFLLKLDTVITGISAIYKNSFAITFSPANSVDLRQTDVLQWKW